MEEITHMQIFGPEAPKARIDMNELVMSGHSFGGITALMAAHKLGAKCKAVQVMDPWLFAYQEEFTSGEIAVKCPVQVINSEMFHPAV